MRSTILASAMVAGLFWTAPALASAPNTERSVPTVNAGQQIDLSCADAGRTGADVHVVMHLNTRRGEKPTGYAEVLATDQMLTPGGVSVRVPNVPGLAHHTVTLKVYVTDGAGTHSCEGGTVRIG